MSGILFVISLIFTSAVVRDFPFQLAARCQPASDSSQGFGLGILLLSFEEHMLFKLDYTDVSETRSLCRGTFPAAGENAKEIIRLSIARCNESNTTHAPYLSVKIDMEQWLAYPQDDPTGIAQMPNWLDENSWWFPPNPFLVLATGFESPEHKPRSLMQRAFELGGLQQVD